MMGAPGDGYGGDHTPVFLSVAPRGGSTVVPTSTSIELTFGAPMAAAMEQYLDLHVGSIAGPTWPMGCAFSSDRTTLTCMPSAPLDPHTTYVLHVGGGLRTESDQAIDHGAHGPGMGGQWLMGGTSGPRHAGHGWGMMDGGWRNANGSYGMVFTFTTA
jgi:hypothetical protein